VSLKEQNRKLSTRLAIVALGMFGFGFALVPFYDQICAALGVNSLVERSELPKNTQVDASRTLMRAGVAIDGLNCVRKHLSQIKGGGLARRCFARESTKRQLVSLIISDVIGDPLDVIASGPTAPDPSTFKEALDVLRQLGILSTAPESVVAYLQAGARGG